jgi:MOSC domain-containing protein YiiM
MSHPSLVALCVGQPTDYGVEGAVDPMDRPWRTAFYKEEVDGPRWLGTTNLEGDRQADTKSHGGPEKAALAYCADHYRDWAAEMPDLRLGFGAFAENLDIAGLPEAGACVGDVYAIGDALVQVSQPRMPCWKISRRWRVPDFAHRVQAAGRTGWYLRVLREGEISAGLEVVLVERPQPRWTIACCNEVMYVRKRDRDLAAELAAVPELAASWRNMLGKRAETGRGPSEHRRLVGRNRG